MALTRISIERAHRVWLETQVIDHGPRSGAKFRFKVIERLFVEDEFDAEDRLRREKSVAFPVLLIEYDNESDFAKRATSLQAGANIVSSITYCSLLAASIKQLI